MTSTFIDNLLRSFTLTLVHSLWMGFIATILAGIILISTRTSKSSFRYGLLCFLFFSLIISISVAFMIEWNNSGSSNTAELGSITGEYFQFSIFEEFFKQVSVFVRANAKWIVLVWLFVIAFKSVRMSIELVQIHRLRNNNLNPVSQEWQDKVQSLAVQLGINKTVRFFESISISIPIVMGHLKPVMLVPVGVLSNFPPSQVEAILLHELAHIRRHDYLINFIQRITELLFFFNPALLWVSTLIRKERENCCDDIAIRYSADKLHFVNALIGFKEYSMNPKAYSLGLINRNELFGRVNRIVNGKNGSLSVFEFAFLVLNLTLLLFVFPIKSGDNKLKSSGSTLTPRPGILESIPVMGEKFSISNTVYLDNKSELKKPGSRNRLSEEKTGKVREKSSAQSEMRNDEQPSFNHHHSEVKENGKAIFSAFKNQDKVSRDQVKEHRQRAEHQRMTAEIYRKQAEADRQLEMRHREQAELDRQQAELHRQQAEKERRHAEKLRNHVITI